MVSDSANIYMKFDDGRFVAGPILKGLKITLNLTWISLILTYIIGLVTALMRLSNSLLARGYRPGLS